MEMNLNEIRQRVDVRDVVDRLGMDYRVVGEDVVIRCRSGQHADRNPSMRVNSEGGERNGLFYCFSCKWGGDLFDLVQKIRDCDFKSSVDFVKRSVGRRIGGFEFDEDAEIYDGTFVAGLQAVAKPGGVVPVLYGSSCYRYLVSRGVGKREIERFGLLDWRTRERVFVPVIVDGVMVSWVARTYVGSKPKALTPKKSSSKNNLFGFDLLNKHDKTISIVEGWLSAIRVWQAGFQNVVATCGSKLSMEQAERLSAFDRIIFWKEGDVAGRVFSVDVADWLGRDRKIVIIELPEGTDPADFSTKRLKMFYQKEIQKWQTDNFVKRSSHSMQKTTISLSMG